MKDKEFGSIMYQGKMVDIDKEEIEKLKTISKELKEKNQILEKISEKIFNQ